MEMLDYHIQELTSSGKLIMQLYTGLPAEMVHWKKAPDKWSLLEVICHLYDEEREDFRARLSSVLDDTKKPFAPIDPAGWVTSRNYAAQDLQILITKLKEERKRSIEWLQTLEKANWENTYQHPKIGPMSAKFILANWLAHDYLHIRQVLNIKYDYLRQFSGENLSYAGDW